MLSDSRLKKIDWDFAGDFSSSLFSSTHWHPSVFVAQIPSVLIGLLSEPGDLVVDPFCGSGTTLVEAQRQGRRSLGIDINPISVMLARSKLFSQKAPDIDKELRELSNKILDSASVLDTNAALKAIPSTVQLQKWYHPETAAELAKLWVEIANIDSVYKPILLSAFSAILIKVCNETRHWGYICDNTKPLSSRRIEAYKAFFAAVEAFGSAYSERDRFLWKKDAFPLEPTEVRHGDALDLMKEIEPESAGIVVTSPPYYGVCDYVKAQRLSMEWFGFEIEPFRAQEIGARSKRARLRAGEEYLAEMDIFAHEVARILRPGRYAAVILGESKARGKVTNTVIAQLKAAGLSLELHKKRKVAEQRAQRPSILEEDVIIMRKGK